MDGSTLLVVLGAAGVVWFWFDSMSAKEQAVVFCKRACEKEGGQLLDQTVQLRKLGVQRNQRGTVQFRREFTFDYSYQGVDRLTGYIVMLGRNVQLLHIDRPSRPDTLS